MSKKNGGGAPKIAVLVSLKGSLKIKTPTPWSKRFFSQAFPNSCPKRQAHEGCVVTQSLKMSPSFCEIERFPSRHLSHFLPTYGMVSWLPSDSWGGWGGVWREGRGKGGPNKPLISPCLGFIWAPSHSPPSPSPLQLIGL